MFDCLFKTKFYSKCKSAIMATKTRVEMIRKKRNATQKYMWNDIAHLLAKGFDINAYQRAERLLVDLNISTCYDFVEQFCVHISIHLDLMDEQRECPEECREAVSSLIFAAARFADLPELRKLRTLFSERFGESLDCYVNKEFVEKLKRDRPSKDMMLELMQDIASESGLEWNSKALENELYNSTESKQNDYGKKNDEKENAFRQRNYHKSPDIAPIRNNEVETTRRNEKRNEAGTLRSDSGEEFEEEEHFSYKNRPPPYTKSEEDQRIKISTEGDHDQLDHEESLLDRLLVHYAEKKAPSETEESDLALKTSPERDSIGTSKATRRRSKDGSSRRTVSLPVELTIPPETPKGHARASSLQPEILNTNRHVHPKLPDYDDFIAKLAALRGN
ncbi:Regulator of Vps4 activity in the MVB pathway protein [Abeliophyllum distichum]|uniref:Regulator of Vps4 activity in the MVB pathway protein n=1 Tax=Abeliophyllum distichum TaxID=126358 RepID=A0ABD1VPG0_9LAMI